MKVTNATGNYEQQAYVKETVDAKKPEAPEAQQAEKHSEYRKGDTVSLSSTSKDIQLAKEAAAAAAAPEERSEKVETIKQSIAEGTYEVDAEKIAEKIIGTNISEIV